jgi:hypothetical protein
MDAATKEILWQQFGAAIAMLENAIDACPEKLWSERSRQPEYWYVAYHTLFWLDLYGFGSVEGYEPPAPFTLEELDPAGIIPAHPYTQPELKGYLDQARQRTQAVIQGLTDETARKRHVFRWGDVSAVELLLYNMRHVQHHAAQLNLILRQTGNAVPDWVGRAEQARAASAT